MEFKTTISVLLFIFSSSLLFSQTNWTLNYDNSLVTAKKDHKPVLLLFTGSDWCPPCKMLEKNILASPEFEEYANKNLVLVKADFPRRPENQLSEKQRSHNDNLNRKFGIRGFPTVLILDYEGNELNRVVGYPGTSASVFIQNIVEKTKEIQKKS
ncbi:MAG: thioredoxin family protein [Saprospiraceae bacterium]|nr:thioredoxin family protein [Saprospiraceae bacterium]